MLNAIWGTDADNLLIADYSGQVFRNGVFETSPPSFRRLARIWGSGPTDIVIVGDRQITGEFDGATWTWAERGLKAFNDVWGVNGSVFAVGEGLIWRRDLSGWSSFSVPSTTTDTFAAIWGVSESNFIIVGKTAPVPGPVRGAIYRFKDSGWQKMSIPDAAQLTAIWGVDMNDVWSVGDAGTMLHFDGTAWSLTVHDASVDLKAVHGRDRDAFGVGTRGAIWRVSAP